MNRAANYTKFFIALLGAAVTTLLQFYPQSKWVQIAVAFLTAVGVYSLPNKTMEGK